MSMIEATCECQTCGAQFEGEVYVDREYHDGYGLRVEEFPEEEECPACRGQGECEGTFTKDIGGELQIVPCTSKQDGKTRWVTETDGSKSDVGVYCDKCAAFYQED